ncbi:MAG: tetratricopeptide repeat protein [Bacteroidota bacterium]
MKKYLILSFSLLFAVTLTFAQDGKKALKDATKALSSFKIGGASDGAKLQEAIDAIDMAVKDSEIGATSKAWLSRGEIYNAVVNLSTTQSLLGDKVEMIDKEAPAKAYDSYSKALEVAEKKWETRDALKGLSECVSNLSNMGIGQYEGGEYATAYKSFNAVLEIHDVLKSNGEKSTLDDPAQYNQQMYITGLAALNSDNMDAAKMLFTKLEETDYEQAALYDALYKINKEDDPEKAIEYLNKGRENYPDDVTLLFTEINHYLSAGQMDVLEDKLKQAIQQEPNNPSLYYTLARVYTDVATKKKEEEDEAAYNEYFNKALEQFNAALEQKPDFYEAMYGIGEMYYNKAANISQAMQNLGTSKEDTKKYNEMSEQMKETFNKALPYFQESEKMNPNDNNTLVALSEIYARRDDFDKVKEFKARIENIRNGGTNESFFKNN